MNLHLTASCLTHVNESTEMTFDCAFKAYDQADLLTELGFEVTKPKSLDGDKTFTITITR